MKVTRSRVEMSLVMREVSQTFPLANQTLVWVRGVRARSARTLVTSLKYHCITHVFENIFNRIPQILRVSLSSNVTKYSPRASRSNTGTIDFDAESFRLNGHRLKLRGFSHHNSFGGLGVSIPDRLWLFRLQMSVALGSNFFRMSHNPYRSSVYDMLDVRTFFKSIPK